MRNKGDLGHPKNVVHISIQLNGGGRNGKYNAKCRIAQVHKDFLPNWVGFSYEEDEYGLELTESRELSVGTLHSDRVRCYIGPVHAGDEPITGYFYIDEEDSNQDRVIIDYERPYEK